ncbi:MAG: PilN domain-containing protein [Formivibrio sp.]|nr:PilN domain-containing protein [Formivibrio sp.]
MIRINLLPHREEKRRARQRRFLSLLVFAFVGAIGVTIIGFTVLSAKIDTQKSRNDFLTAENTKLDHEIAEIDKLKSEKQALLDRKKVVERLQSNRTESVHVLDQLVRQAPEGIYLKDFKQSDDQITLIGYAQSNARVSTFMRNLNDSPVFEQPLLIEVKAATVGNLRLSEFNLRTRVTRATDVEASAVATASVKRGGVK